MQLNQNDIHIWTVDLTRAAQNEKTYLATLNKEECARANRFLFSLHKERFIAARGVLRHLLAMYLHQSPNEIVIAYDAYKKPFLHPSYSNPLQFNLSHSENLALYAFTLNHPIGVDIEKMTETFNPALAERFFSKKEFEALKQLPTKVQALHFYHIWACKEALIKAVGKGLMLPLSSFSVSINPLHHLHANHSSKRILGEETIALENKKWALLSLWVQKDYQAALATTQDISKNRKNVYFLDFAQQQNLLPKETIGK